MKTMCFWKCAFGAVCMLLTSFACPAPSQAQQPVIHVDSTLVLVDVLAQDAKTTLPIRGLKKEDFRVFDNGSEVHVQSFDLGTHYATRPITLWLTVICNQVDWDENGSGFIRDKGKILRPSLNQLDPNDTVAVAHWCDDQTFGVDFAPSRDADGALSALKRIFEKTPRTPGNAPGRIALKGMLREILKTTRDSEKRALPVIVFLYGDHSGMYREEADGVLREILQTSGIVFLVNDGAVPINPLYLKNGALQPNVAHFLAVMTGGQFFSVDPEKFGTALEYILVQVHFRYVLGFEPIARDGTVHKLALDLAEPAKKQFPTIRLTYRSAYVPSDKPD